MHQMIDDVAFVLSKFRLSITEAFLSAKSHQPFRAIGGLESTKELRIILIYFILIYFLIHSIRGGFTLPLPPPLDLF